MEREKHRHRENRFSWALAIGAVGVVFGDIGTSPLYTIKELFSGVYHLSAIPENIFGVLSLIFWALMIVVTIKYVALMMRVDNQGEGGIMALLALTFRTTKTNARTKKILLIAGLCGASLFYGDGVITPAISVTSAVEGLSVAAPFLEPFVVPSTILILLALFLMQYKGTAHVGNLFGPIMCLWFVTIAALGLYSIIQTPTVLQALSPVYAWRFFDTHRLASFFSLGAVVLAFTGAEALYSDMGHFGKKPIRVTWCYFVFPCLLLNYFGQGALLLRDTSAAHFPFYMLVPRVALYPMILLSTMATVIASQAVISGIFSMARQAMQLGFCPRMEVLHTSEKTIGQIYIPAMNRLLLLLVVTTVFIFKTSEQMAAAYGIAVTGTMLATSLLAFQVISQTFKQNRRWLQALVIGLFLIDLAFFSANILKIHAGGWFPLLLGAGVFTLLSTWKKGRAVLLSRIGDIAMSVDDFLAGLSKHPVTRVPGTAVFLTATPNGIPRALLHNLMHNKVLHERVIFLTTTIRNVPHVPKKKRVEIAPLSQNFYRLTLYYGFKDNPNIPKALQQCESMNLTFNLMETSFFLGRATLIPSSKHGMSLWREKLFINMSRNASQATRFFKIPPNRVIELGTQIEL